MSTPTGALLEWAKHLNLFVSRAHDFAKSGDRRFSEAVVLDSTFLNRSKQQTRIAPKRSAVYELHDVIERVVDTLKTSPSGGLPSKAAARTALQKDLMKRIKRRRSRAQKELCGTTYLIVQLLRGVNTNGVSAARAETPMITAGVLKSVPKWWLQRLRDDKRSLARDFDAAPALAQAYFLQELFIAIPLLQMHNPAGSTFKKIRGLSIGGAEDKEAQIINDASNTANTAVMAACVFNAARLKALADKMPVTLSGTDYTVPRSAPSGQDKILKEISPATKAKTPAEIAQEAMKMYISVYDLISQINSTAAAIAPASGGSAVTGEQAQMAAMKRLAADEPLPAGTDAVEVEKLLRTEMEAGVTKQAKALRGLKTIASKTPSAVRTVGGRAMQIVGLYGAMKKMVSDKDFKSATAFVCTVIKDTADLKKELILHKASVEFFDEAAQAAATLGVRRLALAMAAPLVILDVIGAQAGISAALRVNDMSVAFGHFIIGASAAVGFCISSFMYFAGIAAATGPLGVVSVLAMAGAIVGTLLVTLTKDHKIESALTTSFCGKTPQESPNMAEPNFRFGGGGEPRADRISWSLTDLSTQVMDIRSLVFGTGLRLTSKSGPTNHGLRFMHQEIKTGEDKFKEYKTFSMSAFLMGDDGSEIPMANFDITSNAFPLKDVGELTVYWESRGNGDMAEINTRLAAGEYQAPSRPVLGSGLTKLMLELRLIGPGRDGKPGKMVARNRVAIS